MTHRKDIDRRSFVLTNAALAGAAALPGTAMASAVSEAEAPTATGPLSWARATAAELEPLVGQRFRASSAETGPVALRLVAVEPVRSGAARPEGLPRAEGVIAVFDSPDKAPLVEAGHRVLRIGHARLGQADLLLGPVRERDGSHLLELVLN